MSTIFLKLEDISRRTSPAHFVGVPPSNSLKHTIETTGDVRDRKYVERWWGSLRNLEIRGKTTIRRRQQSKEQARLN